MGILDKLFGRPSTSRPVPPQGRTSSIEPQVCERIVREYGAVLEKTASMTFGAPESLLPYPKAEIQVALKQAFVLTQDPVLKEQLKVGYMELARFIPDREARVAAAGNAAILSGNPAHPNWKHVKAMHAISDRILADQQRLLVEVQSRMPAGSGGEEHIVNKQDTDRIFRLSRAEWDAQAKQMVHPEGWKVRLSSLETGTGVMSFDPRTGRGLSVQPFFPRAEGPPDMLVVGSYYAAGTFPQFTDQLRRDMEAAARSDLGPHYSVNISFSRMASSAPGFDVVEVLITRAER